jgi:hypothetical protein
LASPDGILGTQRPTDSNDAFTAAVVDFLERHFGASAHA